MPPREVHWSGWVNCRGDGIQWVEVYKSDRPGAEPDEADVWVGDELADDIEGRVEEFIDAYGEQAGDSIEAFGRGEWFSIREVWPHA